MGKYEYLSIAFVIFAIGNVKQNNLNLQITTEKEKEQRRNESHQNQYLKKYIIPQHELCMYKKILCCIDCPQFIVNSYVVVLSSKVINHVLNAMVQLIILY